MQQQHNGCCGKHDESDRPRRLGTASNGNWIVARIEWRASLLGDAQDRGDDLLDVDLTVA
jgi:hypothetical protein